VPLRSEHRISSIDSDRTGRVFTFHSGAAGRDPMVPPVWCGKRTAAADVADQCLRMFYEGQRKAEIFVLLFKQVCRDH